MAELDSLVEKFESKAADTDELQDWVCSTECRRLLDMLEEEGRANPDAKHELVGQGQTWSKGTVLKRLRLAARARALGPSQTPAAKEDKAFHSVLPGGGF